MGRKACRAAAFWSCVFGAAAAAQPPGMMGGGDRKLVAQFDLDKNGRLDAGERQAARDFLAKDKAKQKSGGKGRGFGPPGGFGKGSDDPIRTGPKMAPADAKSYADAPWYDRAALRTIFLDFEDKDWEASMEDFYRTDVEIPAAMTVDGRQYPNVGVGFRGMSSYFAVQRGRKRSLSLSLDWADKKQRVGGGRQLNLLNGHDDDTYLNAVLYSMVANRYLPAPRVNMVKVVLNGEYWGVYSCAEQFDKEFATERFGSKKSTRWKVPGSPFAQGGLEYLGDDPAKYKTRYALKGKEREGDWPAFVLLCKTLNETPPEKLEAALKPMLDLEGALRFLAVDIALVNCDGYWIRSSDYAIVRDDKGIFHIVPHDMNECFRAPGGPGFGPPGGFGKTKGNPFAKNGPPGFGKDGPQDSKGPPPDFGKDGPPDLGKGPPSGFGKQGDGEKGPAGAAGQGKGGLRPPGGMFGGGGAIKGVELDPLHGLTNKRMPLRSKLLAVPALRARYLEIVRQIAREDLDWTRLGPEVMRLRQLIDDGVKAETRRLSSYEDFARTTADEIPKAREGGGFGPQAWNLHDFADQRRKYLLAYQEKPAGKESPKAGAALGKEAR